MSVLGALILRSIIGGIDGFLNADDNISVETLTHSGVGDEAFGVRSPEIFEFDATTWGMLYMQRSSTSAGGRKGIAYATAPKSTPHTWTKQGQIIAQGSGGSWDEEPAGATIFKESGTWHLYYDGATTGKIGLASGASLGSLTKHASNPLIDNTSDTGAFNRISRHPAFGDKIGSTYYLFYEGRVGPVTTEFETGEITYATSTDLVSWTISDAKPIDSTGFSNGYFKKMAMPTIKKIGDIYFMLVLASDPTGNEPFARGGGLGFATSTDLITWTFVTSEMWLVYLRAQCGDWDTVRQEPSLMIDGSNHALYFSGGIEIGYINLPVGTFDNTLPDSLFEDDFNDGSLNLTKWTKTEVDGKTVVEEGGVLKLKADGLVEATAPVLLISDIGFAWNDHDSFSMSFTWNNTDLSDKFRDFGLLNAARTDGWAVISSSATNTLTLRFRDGGGNNDDTMTIVQGDRLKFVKNQCNVSFWHLTGGIWLRKHTITDASAWAGETFFIQSAIANRLGNSMELQIDDVVIYPFDHNLEGPYDL